MAIKNRITQGPTGKFDKHGREITVGDRISGYAYRPDANVNLPFRGTVTSFQPFESPDPTAAKAILRVTLDPDQKGYIKRFVAKSTGEMILSVNDPVCIIPHLRDRVFPKGPSSGPFPI